MSNRKKNPQYKQKCAIAECHKKKVESTNDPNRDNIANEIQTHNFVHEEDANRINTYIRIDIQQLIAHQD